MHILLISKSSSNYHHE